MIKALDVYLNIGILGYKRMRSSVLRIRIQLSLYDGKSVDKYENERLEVEDDRDIEGPVESVADAA